MNEDSKWIKEPKNIGSTPGSTPLLSRDEVLQKLTEAIEFTHGKIKKGRIRGTDKLRQSWARLAGYLSSVYLQGLKDKEIEDLRERVEKLEQQNEKERVSE